MIVCTKTSDVMVKKAFGKDKISVASIQIIINQMSLDPTISNPVRDAYLVTSDDIKVMKVKQAFINALASKHPKSKIIFIDKASKPTLDDNIPGIDAILTKPKAQQIVDTMSAILSNDSVGEAARMQMSEDVVEAEVGIPKMEDAGNQSISNVTNVAPMVSSYEEEEEAETEHDDYEPLNVPPIQSYEEASVNTSDLSYEKPSSIIERIKNTGTVSDVNILIKEINAATLIKDMIESNSTYAGIEDKLKSLNDSIMLIMNDKFTSLEEKLSKTRSLIHDKNYFATKGDTLFEQRLEDVIETICSQTSSLLTSRLEEIDAAIIRVRQSIEIDSGSARLAGLNEEKMNLILELRTLEAEVLEIYKTSDNIIMEGIASIAEKTFDYTGNEVLNARLRANGDSIISDGSVSAIRAALEMAEERVSPEYKEMRFKVVAMIKVLSKIMDLDNEIIAAQQATINYLREQHVEDTVIVKTLLKKSMRVYIGAEGTGKSIIPYLLSVYQSRQNANVLLVDLTSTGKYEQYGIKPMDMNEFLSYYNEKEFLVVAGEVPDTVATAQRLGNALTKAADYYKVINVVMRPDQVELFTGLAPDVLSVNYITDMMPANLDITKALIEKYDISNVGKRVIFNKCDITIAPALKRIGLNESFEFNICKVPTIPVISDAALNGYDPYGISSVTVMMEDLLRHVRS